MTKQQLLDLAERIEGLSGPCRETDAMIAHVIAWRWDGWIEGDVEIEQRALESVIDRTLNSHNSIFKLLPAYTASLDAAMQLVAPGAEVDLFVNRCIVPGKSVCEVNRKTSVSASPALALTSASLRAKASMMEDE